MGALPVPHQQGDAASEDAGSKLVAVAWAEDQFKAGLIQGLLESGGIPSSQQQLEVNGPQLGFGLLNPGGGSRRVMVSASRAEEARALLDDALVADEALLEPANAEYLADARGRQPRNYGLIGAYARAFLWSVAVMAIAFGVFLIVRGL